MQDNLVSVIIITRNRPVQVMAAIESVKLSRFKQDKLEIIVYDNNDDDITYKTIKSKYEDVIIVGTGEGNKGVSMSRNIAARISKGRFLYFMDDDSWIDKDMIGTLLDVFNKSENIFSVVPHIRFIRDNNNLGPTPSESIDPPFYYSPISFEAAVMIKRDLFFEIGGWSEYLFFGGEGINLSLRAFYSGYYGVMSKKAIAFHPSNASLKKIEEEKDCRIEKLSNSIGLTSVHAITTWPLLPAFMCILKTIFISASISAVKEGSFRLWLSVFKRSVSSFKYIPSRYRNISYQRWQRFRKLSKQPKLELIFDGRDYTSEILGIL